MKVKGLLIAALLLLSCHIDSTWESARHVFPAPVRTLLNDEEFTLDCYSCDYGTCLIPSKISCGLLQLCGTETAKAGYLGLKKRGCMNPTDCLTESTVTYLGVSVTTRRSCCITDLCNSAAAPKVSVITGIATMLALVLAKLF